MKIIAERNPEKQCVHSQVRRIGNLNLIPQRLIVGRSADAHDQACNSQGNGCQRNGAERVRRFAPDPQQRGEKERKQ
jgi:hypothetical protein